MKINDIHSTIYELLTSWENSLAALYILKFSAGSPVVPGHRIMVISQLKIN